MAAEKMFGCCSKYKECSKEGRCIEPASYSNYCSYRQALLRGQNYYCKEKATVRKGGWIVTPARKLRFYNRILIGNKLKI